MKLFGVSNAKNLAFDTPDESALSSCLPLVSLLEGGNMFKKREIKRGRNAGMFIITLIWSKIVDMSRIFTLTHNK